MSAPELSAIVLCYRAGESIRHVIEPLYDQLRAANIEHELLLVANYNRDEASATDPHARSNGGGGIAEVDPTPAIVEQFARGRDSVRTVIAEKRGAMGWDMRSGLDAARGSFMVVIDGDAQNPVEDVLEIHRRMKQTGVPVMKGRRIARFDGSYRRGISLAYNLLFRVVFGTGGLWDINGKPKGLSRAAYERMDLHSDDWFIDAEIVLAARRHGLEIGEFPVVFRRNDTRASFVRPSAILEFVANMVRHRLRG